MLLAKCIWQFSCPATSGGSKQSVKGRIWCDAIRFITTPRHRKASELLLIHCAIPSQLNNPVDVHTRSGDLRHIQQCSVLQMTSDDNRRVWRCALTYRITIRLFTFSTWRANRIVSSYNWGLRYSDGPLSITLVARTSVAA